MLINFVNFDQFDLVAAYEVAIYKSFTKFLLDSVVVIYDQTSNE